ncbi:MAG: hypothetical protein WC280_01765 [Patescibacteria group bacterium]
MAEIVYKREVKTGTSLNSVLTGKEFKLAVNEQKSLQSLIEETDFFFISHFVNDKFIEELSGKERLKNMLSIKMAKLVVSEKIFFPGKFFREMDRDNFRPATFRETLVLARTFPELIEKITLVSLGTKIRGMFSCLYSNGKTRYLEFYGPEGVWVPKIGILLVKK